MHRAMVISAKKCVSERANIAVVVLGAGASTRMGRPKQLLRYGEQTLLVRAAQAALDTQCGPVYVVVPDDPVIGKELLGLPIQIVVNTDAGEGIASSIRAGLQTATKSTAIDGVLFTLVDQPFVRAHELKKMVSRFNNSRGSGVVAAGYDGVVGVPAIFPRQLFDRILALRGDQGARNLLKELEGEVHRHSLIEAAVDLDTVDDHERLLCLGESNFGRDGQGIPKHRS